MKQVITITALGDNYIYVTWVVWILNYGGMVVKMITGDILPLDFKFLILIFARQPICGFYLLCLRITNKMQPAIAFTACLVSMTTYSALAIMTRE